VADDFPLIADAKSLYTKAMSALEQIPTPGHKAAQKATNEADTEMVKEANASFMPKTVAKKPAQKAVRARTGPLANRRTPRKR
jgi:hypothetical protein